jgi:hypothetical protein
VLRRPPSTGAKAVVSRTPLARAALCSGFVCRGFDPVLVMTRGISGDRQARIPSGAGALDHRFLVLGRRDQLDACRAQAGLDAVVFALDTKWSS